MITLPFPPRRARLISFWLAMSLVGGLLVATLCMFFLSRHGVVLGGSAALILALPGLIQPQIAYIPYKAWNKLAGLVGRGTRFCLMAICFYIVIPTIGRTGSQLRLDRPKNDESQWVPWRGHNSEDADGNLHGIAVEESTPEGWSRAFLNSIKRLNKWWAYCLLPFFILTRALEGEGEQSEAPTSIYTLY